MGEKEKEKEKDIIIRGLRVTIGSQQKLLHKLYAELEAERESSSTAATEAMSMILRLQEEKAAEMLQATQFKRLIQQKMDHANLILRHKEFQIASLEFQLQAYHYKMLSFGLPGNLTRIHSLPAAIQFADESALTSYWEQIKELDEPGPESSSSSSSSSLSMHDVFEVPQRHNNNNALNQPSLVSLMEEMFFYSL